MNNENDSLQSYSIQLIPFAHLVYESNPSKMYVQGKNSLIFPSKGCYP